MNNQPYPTYDYDQISDLNELINNQLIKRPDETAFLFRDGDSITKKTFRTFSDDIKSLGTYLGSSGLSNIKIAIVGENSYEWLVSFFSVANSGNTAVPIDKALHPEEICSLLRRCDCKAVFYSEKFAGFIPSMNDEVLLFKLDELSLLIEHGNRLLQTGETCFTDHKIHSNDIAAIFFTSGTTGISKGVMLSHGNFATDVIESCKYFKLDGSCLSVLPFNHAYGLVTSVMTVFHKGQANFINKQLKQIINDFQIAQPQTVCLVPLFVEYFYKQIMAKISKLGSEHSMQIINGLFGGNLKYIVCGGAILDEKYIDAFRAWGITILNGYGITECSPCVAINRNNYQRKGSVGLIFENCQIKISEEGEILVKGKNVMQGYYDNPKETEEVLKDGWFCTGDLGYVDSDGFLFITGRKKNLIILSNGENISPEPIEQIFLLDPGVKEVMVKSKDNQLVAEIFPSEKLINDIAYFETIRRNYNLTQPLRRQISKIILRSDEFQKNVSQKIIRHNNNKE